MSIGNQAQNLADLDERETLLKLALAIRRETLGDVHQWTSWSFVSLSELYYDRRNLLAAIEYARLGVDAAKGISGPALGDALAQLGVSLSENGEHEQAICTCRKASAAMSESLGSRHVKTLDTERKLGTCLFNAGEVAECLKLAQKTKDATIKWLGAEHHHLIKDEFNLGVAYSRLGEPEEAIHHLNQSNELVISLHGEQNHLIIRAAIALSREYLKTLRPKKALEAAEQAINVARTNGVKGEELVACIVANVRALLKLDRAPVALFIVLNSRAEFSEDSHWLDDLEEVERQICDASKDCRRLARDWRQKN